MGIETASLAAIGTFLGGVGAVGSLAMGLMGGGGKPPTPAMATQEKQQTSTPQQAVDRQRKQAASASSNANTILTNPLGLTDPANTARPTLLGR